MILATEDVAPTKSGAAAEDTEVALVHAAKERDMGAFEQLLGRNRAMVFTAES